MDAGDHFQQISVFGQELLQLLPRDLCFRVILLSGHLFLFFLQRLTEFERYSLTHLRFAELLKLNQLVGVPGACSNDPCSLEQSCCAAVPL